jgi:hypothetical protein
MHGNIYPSTLTSRKQLPTMHQCGKFDSVLWATTGSLLLHYGPMRGIFSAQWLTMGNLFFHCGPPEGICFCGVGHCTELLNKALNT